MPPRRTGSSRTCPIGRGSKQRFLPIESQGKSLWSFTRLLFPRSSIILQPRSEETNHKEMAATSQNKKNGTLKKKTRHGNLPGSLQQLFVWSLSKHCAEGPQVMLILLPQLSVQLPEGLLMDGPIHVAVSKTSEWPASFWKNLLTPPPPHKKKESPKNKHTQTSMSGSTLRIGMKPMKTMAFVKETPVNETALFELLLLCGVIHQAKTCHGHRRIWLSISNQKKWVQERKIGDKARRLVAKQVTLRVHFRLPTWNARLLQIKQASCASATSRHGDPTKWRDMARISFHQTPATTCVWKKSCTI